MQVKDKVLDGVGKHFVAHGLGLPFGLVLVLVRDERGEGRGERS